MEYGSKEYKKALKNFLAVVVKEGEAGHFTDKGINEDGTDAFFRIIGALEPWGIFISISIEAVEEE